MRSTRLVLFDFDGTLADSFPWFVATLNDMAATHGFRRIGPDEVESLRGHSARYVAAQVGLRWWRLPAVGRDFRRRMIAEAPDIRLFDGVDDMLRDLARGGIAVAVVTSNAEANVRRMLGAELSALVRHWECGASMFGKASRFRRVLRASGVPAAQALAIGDELRDLEAAREAGIRFAGVAWGFTRPQALDDAGVDVMFQRVEEIGKALAGRGHE